MRNNGGFSSEKDYTSWSASVMASSFHDESQLMMIQRRRQRIVVSHIPKSISTPQCNMT